ncbi:NAD(P)/FAD-dependent oxidoreductase [Janibacter cremeus]|uniref:NAD(P)/FAD-dependent oxidoreductase n=1 Tax=Janibacter cremeus TaxID=1285192 RepID=UPI0023F9954F|nr:NAD(P)/FAD-dependent oxidoreductase [Janibacter cremeus]WEV78179.1 NAD(P)/FAD-dependent oxidoreductase [Janibacter cremeus]WEV78259.1 NAD(P)/FAD-dependent oxidoreductase [Janibacter cremeus]
MSANSGKHHVVIIGSGFGGLFAAKELGNEDVDVTLISRTSHHLFQPLLYQVATGILSEGDIAPTTRDILGHQRNVRVILGDVQRIDVEARTVHSESLNQHTVTHYDSLIVAAGAGQSYFGNNHFARFAPGMKSIDDALELRGRIFGSFELAETSTDPEQRRRLLTFVVVGAGPTGVEMAGQIAELAQRTLADEFRHIDPGEARVVLLDGAPKVLPTFGDRLSDKARRSLEKQGVEVQLEAMVTDVNQYGIEVKDGDGSHRTIETMTKVWAAGVAGSPLGAMLAEQTDVEVDRAGRVHVEENLTVPGHPEIFVVGDMINLKGYPGVAQLAIQGGRYAAKEILARLAGKEPQAPFRYRDKGSMATISKYSAVASIGRINFTGFLAWLAWLAVHLMAMVGFKNRVSTLLNWIITFVGDSRNERVSTFQQVFARTAMQDLGPSAYPNLADPGPDGDDELEHHAS